MTTLGAMPIGAVVRIPISGVAQEFIIVHRGRPSGLYDAGFNNGIVVMLNQVDWTERRLWGSESPDYSTSSVHSWLNSTYLNRIGELIRGHIRQVRIPFRQGSEGSTIASGDNGLLTRAFILSMYELGLDASIPDMLEVPDGTRFSFFLSGESEVAMELRASTGEYWTRTPARSVGSVDMFNISSRGGISTSPISNTWLPVRPAFVLPPDLLVLPDGTLTVNTAPTTPSSITIPDQIEAGTPYTVSWGASTDAENNISHYRVERSTNAGTSWQFVADVPTTPAGAPGSLQSSIGIGNYSVIYRVRAVDSAGASSGWRTSNQVIVFNPSINTPPGTPGVIIIPEVINGDTLIEVSWSASADAEGNLAGYRLYKSTDGGTTWYNVYDGPELSTTSFIFFGTESVIFRVRAYDSEGLNSGYRTSEQIFVNNVHPSHENFREANITEIRIFENPEDTANSWFDVALPITVPGAIVGLDEYLDIYLAAKGLI